MDLALIVFNLDFRLCLLLWLDIATETLIRKGKILRHEMLNWNHVRWNRMAIRGYRQYQRPRVMFVTIFVDCYLTYGLPCSSYFLERQSPGEEKYSSYRSDGVGSRLLQYNSWGKYTILPAIRLSMLRV